MEVGSEQSFPSFLSQSYHSDKSFHISRAKGNIKGQGEAHSYTMEFPFQNGKLRVGKKCSPLTSGRGNFQIQVCDSTSKPSFSIKPWEHPYLLWETPADSSSSFLTTIICDILFIILNGYLSCNQIEEKLFIGTVMLRTTCQNILKFMLFIKISKQFKVHISILNKC